MEITVLKCDRCKREVGGLIEFSFINRNVELDSTEGSESRLSLQNLNNLMFGTFNQSSRYPTISGGLCLDCIQEISRWLGHQENVLTGSRKQ